MRNFYESLTKFKGDIPEPLYETVAVLSYEVGKMMEQAMYLHWFGDDPVRRGFLKSELMDAIAQCQLICESLNCNFEEMRNMGVEKAMERFECKEHK